MNIEFFEPVEQMKCVVCGKQCKTKEWIEEDYRECRSTMCVNKNCKEFLKENIY